MNVENVIQKTKDFLRRLYPVIYADEFRYRHSTSHHSAVGDQYLSRKREELIKSALRYNNSKAK
jgi:hypothetical protein